MVTLRRAAEEDSAVIQQIQVKAFAPLLVRYKDHDSSPAAESRDDILRRFAQRFTDYYLICLGEEKIGVLRVCNFGMECRLSPIGIVPDHQGHGYAQRAMRIAEQLYPKARRWTLETIAQEPKLCYLYEKMGYRKTGRVEHIKEGMDLVYYEKEVN